MEYLYLFSSVAKKMSSTNLQNLQKHRFLPKTLLKAQKGMAHDKVQKRKAVLEDAFITDIASLISMYDTRLRGIEHIADMEECKCPECTGQSSGDVDLTGAIVRTAGFEGQGERATVLTAWHDFHEGRPATGSRPESVRCPALGDYDGRYMG